LQPKHGRNSGRSPTPCTRDGEAMSNLSNASMIERMRNGEAQRGLAHSASILHRAQRSSPLPSVPSWTGELNHPLGVCSLPLQSGQPGQRQQSRSRERETRLRCGERRDRRDGGNICILASDRAKNRGKLCTVLLRRNHCSGAVL
jgi:hypothetical protein